MWLGVIMVRALDLWLKRMQVQMPAIVLGKLFLHICLCHEAVWFDVKVTGEGQGTEMPCDWQGNRKSGFALAIWWYASQTSVVYLRTCSWMEERWWAPRIHSSSAMAHFPLFSARQSAVNETFSVSGCLSRCTISARRRWRLLTSATLLSTTTTRWRSHQRRKCHSVTTTTLISPAFQPSHSTLCQSVSSRATHPTAP